ncbi:MAG: tandem-95 repeat protein [Alphaproteobacteria bacterium]|nr:tandem-95 repeat protein [Alphaproteobacteria bacterium]
MPGRGPQHGTVVLDEDGQFTYVPQPGFSGTDGFDYRIEDGKGGADIGRVDIVVEAVNEAPVAADDNVAGFEDRALDGSVLADNGNGVDTDPDGDPLTAALIEGPGNGALNLSADGSFRYVPPPGFHGTDGFTYRIDDGRGGSDQAVVIIRVRSVNDDPIANDDTTETDEEVPVTVDVLGNDRDPDGDPLTASLLDPPVGGTVTGGDDGRFTYTPNPDFAGADHFTYALSDGQGGRDTAMVAITVNGLNDTPVSEDDGGFIAIQTVPLTIAVAALLANDTDVDGDMLVVTAAESMTPGVTVALANDPQTGEPVVLFTATKDFDGERASFAYTATDGSEDSTATVEVVIALNFTDRFGAGSPDPSALFAAAEPLGAVVPRHGVGGGGPNGEIGFIPGDFLYPPDDFSGPAILPLPQSEADLLFGAG